MPAKRLESLLNPNELGDLGDIVRRAGDMGQLAQILRSALPPAEAEGLGAAVARDDGLLVVLAPTPAWAARLRFESDTLLAAARAAGLDVRACKVRVARN